MIVIVDFCVSEHVHQCMPENVHEEATDVLE